MFAKIPQEFEKFGLKSVKGKISIVKTFSPNEITSLKINLKNVNHFDIDILIKELKSYKEELKKDFDSKYCKEE